LRDAVLAGLKAEFKSVLKRQHDLNREMMRLSIATRCQRWVDYYRRMDELTTRRQRIERAAAFLSARPFLRPSSWTINSN
jgi:hypothetical protein